MFLLDCTTPFTVSFHTNTAGTAETITTIAQRGESYEGVVYLNKLLMIFSIL